jgi:two-component system, OmpR family, sensor histidine kinase VicK
VNNVLDLQRIESGEVTMEKQVCDAAELMVQATESMQAMAQHQGIVLTTQPLSIPVWVDPDYIVQTLTNLLSNAIKFSVPGGTVWLTVGYRQQGDRKPRTSRRKSPPPTEVLFQVRDRGQGIPVDKLERIFERFHQVDSSDSRKKGGTGLGLAICRKIVEQHEGSIWAESRMGQGSTFSFTLPAVKEERL